MHVHVYTISIKRAQYVGGYEKEFKVLAMLFIKLEMPISLLIQTGDIFVLLRHVWNLR